MKRPKVLDAPGRVNKPLAGAVGGLVFNLLYGGYHVVMGGVSRSWWLLTVGAYYAVLSVLRFAALITRRREELVRGVTGWMLMLLSLPIFGTVILSAVEERAVPGHMIFVIAMATYCFAKLTAATVNLVKARLSPSAGLLTLRNVSFADACVSIFTLQRLMLVSFGDMEPKTRLAMNLATGTAVCLAVLLLGWSLARSSGEPPRNPQGK